MTLPPLPDLHALAALALTGFALYLFRREDLQLETACLFILIVLAVSFEYFPYKGPLGTLDAISVFQNFGNEALITICGLIMAGEGISRTGALEPMGRFLARFWRFSPSFALLATLLVTAAVSPFVNNTPTMIVMIPILVSVSLRAGHSPSAVLMPTNHANLLGGMVTTIGTSTNLLVIDVARRQGLAEIGMFDFVFPASLAAGIGVLYLWLIAPRLLPTRAVTMDTSPRMYSAQLHVHQKSLCNGRNLKETVQKTGGLLQVEKILRGDDIVVAAVPHATLRAGDRLVVSESPAQLKELEKMLRVTLIPGELRAELPGTLQADDQQLAEVVVAPHSTLVGRSLKEERFLEKNQLLCLALHRAGIKLDRPQSRLADEPLRTGDVLLVQGPKPRLHALKMAGDLLVLDGSLDLPRSRRAPLALLIMAGVVTAAALGWLPIAISALCGVLLMVLSRCMKWQEAVQGLSLQVILVMATSLSLGNAILYSGAADWLASLFVAFSFGAPVAVSLSGLMLLIAIFTNLVDNNAAAVIGTPIAIGVARQLGVEPIPFVIATLLAANLSLATPTAYKTNILIWNAGGYTFNDFLRVGLPLMLLMWLALSVIVPWHYQLF
ncbi:SLC13 family permease [Permianibacter sp. IMCC34836]|uniref:SLC13 family permease n=1 Tax=Permianibacter fluminis TaxID=2738515 RepID=UPI001555C558|nr:SLC13 family permease [Permianibacter fluminis]NQD36620.1 SLC13 family permease [Permianibacter fluminis]